MSKLLLRSFLHVLPKDLPIYFITSFICYYLNISSPPFIQPTCKSLGGYGAQVFRLHIGLFSVSTSFIPHFLWGDRLHFHNVYCVSGLFKELGIYYTYHWLFLLKAIGANSFGPLPF
jgi:hypothetical protein